MPEPLPDLVSSNSASNLPEISVSELAGAVKRTLEGAFDRVRVRGELGRVTIAKSGHLYADLKDDNAVISMIMWKGAVQQIKFRPEEGLEVIAEGKLTTYAGRSQYQLVAERLEPAGAGALMALLDERRRRLAAEGLFAPERKLAIPQFPQVIGVVTSPTGAVIRDILHRIRERFPVHVLVWPVLVQGEKAAQQIADAINGFNALPADGSIPRPDVLIVARGGGSLEDLWAFNEEIVVRAAANSRIPLISAIGHETDTTLIDFAASLRAPTPTGAAEKVTPVRAEWMERIQSHDLRLARALRRLYETARLAFEAAQARWPQPQSLFLSRSQRFDQAAALLDRALQANNHTHLARFGRIEARLRPSALTRDIAQRAERLSALARRLAPAMIQQGNRRANALAPLAMRMHTGFEQLWRQRVARFELQAKLLDSLSYYAVLARGYAVIRDKAGQIVRSARLLQVGEAVDLFMAQGQARATITETRSDVADDAAPGSTPRTADDEAAQATLNAEADKKRMEPSQQNPRPAKKKDDPHQGSLF